jgi:hypothetical protein
MVARTTSRTANGCSPTRSFRIMSLPRDPPRKSSPAEVFRGPGSVDAVAPSSPDPGLDWRQYLDKPDPKRLGIACSGGGIRSASYCLGGLQELRRRGQLDEAEYLSCVSGGGYTAIAHEVLVSESLNEPYTPCWRSKWNPFDRVAPYAVGSPEERHLRSHLNYIAPGGTGRIWLLANLIGGMVRHLLPFVAALYVVAWLTGMALTRWVGPSIGVCRDFAKRCPKPLRNLAEDQQVHAAPFLKIVGVMLLLTLLVLVARQLKQTVARPNDDALWVLQNWILLLLAAAGISAFFLVVVPAGLIVLHWLPLGWEQGKQIWIGLGIETALLGTVIGAVWRMRRGVLKTLGAVVTTIATPVLILMPFLGLTYWVAHGGPHWYFEWGITQTTVLIASVALFVLFSVLNEVTSLPHLFYRERLATAFIGRRNLGPFETLGYNQPPWSKPLAFSELRRCKIGPAILPKLVVCTAVNLSDVVPTGRGGAPFTFERDFVGGPVTGYVRTRSMEQRAGSGTVTMPALMAISGAAVAPSMGKMTRAGLRFAMALFDLRLGVWLPNPRRDDWVSFTALEVWAQRRAPRAEAEEAAEVDAANAKARARSPIERFQRPGTKFVFYEALGKNSLSEKHVYISDGGHFDNLGLVELLRRGCGKVIVLDAAGDDIHHFNTLSEAIELAHADLGIQFDLDMTALTPRSDRHEKTVVYCDKEDGEPEEGRDDKSPRCSVVGTYRYPNGSIGQILLVKAAMCDQVPIEVLTYRERDEQFPNHPTTNQMFSELTFESYRTLGEHAVREAFEGGDPW